MHTKPGGVDDRHAFRALLCAGNLRGEVGAALDETMTVLPEVFKAAGYHGTPLVNGDWQHA